MASNDGNPTRPWGDMKNHIASPQQEPEGDDLLRSQNAELIEENHRLRARVQPRRVSGWRPIESAPKDGTMVDLWCVDPEGEFVPEQGGIRLTDCSWDDAKVWVRILADGDRDVIEDYADNPLGLPPWKPTHWMPLPAPPITPTEGGEHDGP